MGRGRRKGGIRVNDINDKTELQKMIINQINSLNKKIKAFKAEGIDDHLTFIKSIITDDMGTFTESGTLSKSKKLYEGKHKAWLKKTLSALVKLNNNDVYGTTNKYHKTMTRQLEQIKNKVENFLRSKGYSEQFIFNVVSNKNFYITLIDAFNNATGDEDSDQIIEKVALNFDNGEIPNKEKEKILNNIEYSINTLKRIKEEQEAFEEFKRLRNGRRR